MQPNFDFTEPIPSPCRILPVLWGLVHDEERMANKKLDHLGHFWRGAFDHLAPDWELLVVGAYYGPKQRGSKRFFSNLLESVGIWFAVLLPCCGRSRNILHVYLTPPRALVP